MRAVSALAKFNRQRMPARRMPNPFLSGGNTPLQAEYTLTDLAVTGQIPPELSGRYVRIGPNPMLPPLASVHAPSYHWFSGAGMVHGLRLAQGRAVWYKNRWVRSNAVSRALGEPPARGPRYFGDNANTHVAGLAGKTWALVEAGAYPVELDFDLNTVAHNNFEGTLRGSFSAHFHTDPTTGDSHAVCYAGNDQKYIRHVVVGADGRVRREERIPVLHGPSVHDCMVTENYVLVLDLSVTFSLKTYIAGFEFPYVWNAKHRARVGVLGKNAPAASIIWCDISPCYVFHPSNAFENADGSINLDVVAHTSMFEHSNIGPNSADSALERWTIDLNTKSVARRVLDARPQEFPRLNEAYISRDYRYCYTVALKRDDTQQFVSDQFLLKHDLQTGTRSQHDFGAGQYPSEFVFVARAGSQFEDDGWLMGYVVDSNTQTTQFHILNAQDMVAAPVASVHIPHAIPAGFHGNWIASAA